MRLHPETAELIPGLAESWSEEEGGTAYVFNLRKGELYSTNPIGLEMEAEKLLQKTWHIAL